MALKKKSKMIKKKIKEEKEETSSGVKLGSVNIKATKAKVKEEEARKAGRSDNKYYKSPQGRRYLGVIPPTSDDMNGLPTVDKIMHNNLGPDGNGFGQCQRPNLDKKTRDDCRACRKSGKMWDLHRQAKKDGDKKSEAKYKKLAMDLGPKAKPLAQIIDLTGAYDKAGKVVDKVPTCFGENLGTDEEKYNKCRRCPFLESCQNGVQNWEMPFGAYTALMEKLSEEEVDVTNPSEMLPIKVLRKGEGKEGTKYTISWATQPIKLPTHLITFIEKHAVDLTKKVVPSTDEQMLAMMTGNKKKDSDETNISKKKSKSKGEFKSKKNYVKPKVSKEEMDKMRSKLKADSAKKKKVKV